MGPLASYATSATPFFFITDFSGQKIECYTLDALKDAAIYFDFSHDTHEHSLELQAFPIPFTLYKERFDRIIDAIKRGETYVLNFTQITPIQTPSSLQEIYHQANARFKLLYKDQFVCFSPEPFITIEGDTIRAYPMKGTIDANLPRAKETILTDTKEHAEHTMIVDLLRNDLSQIARDVRVKAFRYVESIKAGKKELLQVSSKIEGTLPSNWKEDLDTIISKLLPAGSISGAPKRSTLKHIQSVEAYDRGFFTGVMGYFDGSKLESSVMIRFIEKTPKGLIYKSGGGITLDSDPRQEYQEMIDKIYIP